MPLQLSPGTLKKAFQICLVITILLVVGTIYLYTSPAATVPVRNVFPFANMLQFGNTIRAPTTSVPTSRTNTDLSQDNRSITVVTAYFDIGNFFKGTETITFTPDTYTKWAERFRYILNPVILYTDSKEFADYFNSTRAQLANKTRIFLIHKNSSWAFQRKKKIAAIFEAPGYPRHLPNTVVPEYACAQFAKYDVISRAAKEDIFATKYYMWLDIGYFRDRLNKTLFYLEKPTNFSDSRIGMNLVNFQSNMSELSSNIFKQNLVWVGGGVVFGERNLLMKYETQFMKAVDYFISAGLMNTDQQVTYAMFSDEGRKAIDPVIELHVYKPPKTQNWFYLGNSMIREVA